MGITLGNTACNRARTVAMVSDEALNGVVRSADCLDTDINVPLIVRGPGIPQNETLDVVTSHTDLAPTFLSLAGTTRPGLDGKRIPMSIKAGNADNKTEHVAIEYWGRVCFLSFERSRIDDAGCSPRESTGISVVMATSLATAIATILTKA